MSIAAFTRGRTIGGRYVLQATLSADGIGNRWLARDQRSDHDVAVQEALLPPGVSATERRALYDRSAREARVAATLRHASVVPVVDVVAEEDRVWVILALVEGRSVDAIIRDEGPLSPAVVADMGLHVLGALEAAHVAGILHRDVNPINVVLGAHGRAHLTGFGAAHTSGDAALTSAGLALCSPPYIPPERARGEQASAASDLWSLGAVLYTAVEGHPPFDAGDPMPTIAMILADSPAQPVRAGPLAAVLAGLLENDPARRWDVERARAGLRAVLTGDNPAAAAALPAPAQVPPNRQRAAPRRGSTERVTARTARGIVRGIANHRTALAVGALALMTAVVVALLLSVALSDLTTVAATPAAPTAVPSVQPAIKAKPKPSGSPNAAGVPAAKLPSLYIRYEHRPGFLLVVPKGWVGQSQSNGDMVFRDLPTGRIIAVQEVRNAGRDIRDYWRAGHFDQRTKPGYNLEAIRTATLGGFPAADWEFTRTQGSGTAATVDHTIGRGTIVDGTAYVVYLSAAEADFAASVPILDRVADSFELNR